MSFVDTALCQEYTDILNKNKPTMAIEVGGFDGYFSKYAYDNLCNNVYCFEASLYVWNRFKETFNTNINYINAAICDYSGLINFKMQKEFSPEMIGHNSIKYRNDLGEIEEESVICYSLDDFFIDKVNHTDNIALWIDAEGASKDILLGMQNLLNTKLISSIFIEVEHFAFWKNSWLKEDIDLFLEKNGFELYSIKKQYDKQSNAIYRLKE